MVRKKITWMAELGKYPKEFPTKKKAVEAEEEYKLEQNIYDLENIFRKYFKTYYGDRDRYDSYLYFCVDCGKKLLQYKCENDGHRNERGAIIFSDKEADTFFEGMRCKKCYEKAKKLFEKMILFYFKKTKIVNILCLDSWASFRNVDKNTKLNIFEVVNYYDRNFKKKIKEKNKCHR